MAPKLTMTYFDFNFWRAEVGRLALHIGGLPFDDVRLAQPEMKAAKAEGAFPFGPPRPG
jgi:hypothetical protein